MAVKSKNASKPINFSPAPKPIQFAAIDKLPQSIQALQVVARFQNVKSREDFYLASDLWEHVRGKLSSYEKSLSCEDYSEGAQNLKIATGLVDDLTEKPWGLALSVINFILSFASLGIVEIQDSQNG